MQILSNKSKIKGGEDVFALFLVLFPTTILDFLFILELACISFAVESLPGICDEGRKDAFTITAAPIHTSSLCQI